LFGRSCLSRMQRMLCPIGVYSTSRASSGEIQTMAASVERGDKRWIVDRPFD
jgi:hypothetical protein